MEIWMIILIVIVLLIVYILIKAASLENTFRISGEIIINKPVELVYDYIKFLKNSEKYNTWVMRDPNMKTELVGIDGTEGFIYRWDSEDKGVGKGEQEIIQLTTNVSVLYEIRFIKPFENIAGSKILLKPAESGNTLVSWEFNGDRNYLMKLLHMVFNLGRALKKDIDQSLINLKLILEIK